MTHQINTMNRSRPQPPAPDSWHNPTTREPVEAVDPTPLQQEIIAEIEGLQQHLNLILERIKADAPIGGVLVIKAARINFLLGKYQHWQDLRAENLAATQAADPGYKSSGYEAGGIYPQPSPEDQRICADSYANMSYTDAAKLSRKNFNEWQRIQGIKYNSERDDH